MLFPRLVCSPSLICQTILMLLTCVQSSPPLCLFVQALSVLHYAQTSLFGVFVAKLLIWELTVALWWTDVCLPVYQGVHTEANPWDLEDESLSPVSQVWSLEKLPLTFFDHCSSLWSLTSSLHSWAPGSINIASSLSLVSDYVSISSFFHNFSIHTTCNLATCQIT